MCDCDLDKFSSSLKTEHIFKQNKNEKKTNKTIVVEEEREKDVQNSSNII